MRETARMGMERSYSAVEPKVPKGVEAERESLDSILQRLLFGREKKHGHPGKKK